MGPGLLSLPVPSRWAVIASARRRQSRRRRRNLVVTAAVLVIALAGVAALRFGGGVTTTAGPYRVCAANVYGLWRYTYGAARCTATGKASGTLYSYADLALPAGATVDLTVVRSQGPHSLRIAALGLTIHAGARSTSETTFRVPHGNETYSGKCLTGCLGVRTFAGTNVMIMTPMRYRNWVAVEKSLIAKQTSQLRQLGRALVREGVLAPNS